MPPSSHSPPPQRHYPPPSSAEMPDSDIHYIGLEPRPSLPRRTMPFTVLGSFLVVLLWMGILNEFSLNPDLVTVDAQRATTDSLPVETEYSDESAVETSKHKGWPDFSNYRDVRTVSAEELGLDDPNRRVIFVGDIHGMEHSLNDLLHKIKYSPSSDYLVHTGDFLTKGPHSLQVLNRMSSQNITGVRGNHDQKILEWKSFIIWLGEQEGGKEWLEEMEKMDLSPKQFRKLGKHKKKFDIPDGWEWGSEHFKIAKKITDNDYKYLLQLPLVLHLESLHTHVVHAGILPADPKRSLHNRHQPLAHLPKNFPGTKSNVELIRAAQELTILTDVPQNRKGWAKLNMRDILKNGEITRDAGEGRPWSNMWNEVQKLCKGFDGKRAPDDGEEEDDSYDDPDEAGDLNNQSLPCHPTTVVYGHAAGRSLDIKRWSQGLDTGCVYGRKLTAMIIGSHKHKGLDQVSQDGDEELEELRFGDNSKARLVSVKCKAK
ncbi:hypothetical protein FRC03_000903 [Tulasnella sp. 419]|nr:hypothetical protein FRC03_000903 [Tulasnella sp. 419]